MTRIALIHAVQAAMQPVEEAFRAHWREPRRTNLLDDSLAPDREQAGRLTSEISERIVTLARYAVASGADGVLFTCSAFGEAIDAAAKTVKAPVLKPNEAMFDAALQVGGLVGMLATFAPAVASMEEEFAALARQRGSKASLTTIVAPGAREALMAGELDRHNRLVADSAAELAGCDVIMLAHFSMGGAASLVSEKTGRPALAAPESAVLKLRSLLSESIAR